MYPAGHGDASGGYGSVENAAPGSKNNLSSGPAGPKHRSVMCPVMVAQGAQAVLVDRAADEDQRDQQASDRQRVADPVHQAGIVLRAADEDLRGQHLLLVHGIGPGGTDQRDDHR